MPVMEEAAKQRSKKGHGSGTQSLCRWLTGDIDCLAKRVLLQSSLVWGDRDVFLCSYLGLRELFLGGVTGMCGCGGGALAAARPLANNASLICVFRSTLIAFRWHVMCGSCGISGVIHCRVCSHAWVWVVFDTDLSRVELVLIALHGLASRVLLHQI